MPLQLTTTIGVGDLDPSVPSGLITHCRIKFLGNHPELAIPFMALFIEYGYLVEGVFTPASVSPSQWVEDHNISGSEWTSLVGSAAPDVLLADPSDPTYVELDVGGTPVWVELSYAAVKRGLYEHLITEGVIPAGTVV
jgi:hypothetical protein